MERYSVTGEEMNRYNVLKNIQDGLITTRHASEVLGLSYRQVLRLKKRFHLNGIEGIRRKPPSKTPNKKVDEQVKQTILDLRKTLYHDFNILHFKEKLCEVHEINLSYETVRKVLIKDGFHTPKAKRKVYRRRRRMPQSGLLVQMDSSIHRWIENINKSWWLIAMIDDGDGVVYAEFHPVETTMANMKVIKEYILKRGTFMALYTDKASHFKTTRHGGIHNNVSLEQEDTQIQRALSELDIKLINANSPQAKGRIERLFRFFQDRLIKEMRLIGIKNYDEANRFLKEEFLPWYNQKYALNTNNAYKEIPKDCNLELIFSLKYPRKVQKDNTISYKGKIYQLLPTNGIRTYALRWIDVCETLNGEIKLQYEQKIIPYLVINKQQYKETKAEEILSMRKPISLTNRKKYSPPPDHPWRKFFKPNNVTFQRSNKV